MKTIRPEAIDENRVRWTGYLEGALLALKVKDWSIINGDTIITIEGGRRFNCHPFVTQCGSPDIFEGKTMTRSEDILEVKEGVYPIRFELEESEEY